MSTMADVDIFLQEAGEQVEDAARRLRAALDALGLDRSQTRELRGAFADLYDAGIDTVLELRGVYARSAA